MNEKCDLKKLETSLYRTVENTFRYVESFTRNLRVWQTDGRTGKHYHSKCLAYL